MNRRTRCCSAPPQRWPTFPKEWCMARDPQSVTTLWQAFKDARTAVVRERLALAYLPLVRTQARQMTSRVPPTVKSEDLEGYGMIGLLEAIDRFDTDRGIPFEAFARLRIRGAMYDYLRTLDLLPRIARRNVHREIGRASCRERVKISGRGASE